MNKKERKKILQGQFNSKTKYLSAIISCIEDVGKNPVRYSDSIYGVLDQLEEFKRQFKICELELKAVLRFAFDCEIVSERELEEFLHCLNVLVFEKEKVYTDSFCAVREWGVKNELC